MADTGILNKLSEEFRQGGLQPFTNKQVDKATGADRETWAEAIKREDDSLNNLRVVRRLTEEELLNICLRDILPSMAVCGVKDMARKKVRLVACGNFASRPDGALSTQQVDASAARLIAQAAEMQGWSLRICGVETAFLRADFCEKPKKYYVRSPAIVERFGVVDPNTVSSHLGRHGWSG